MHMKMTVMKGDVFTQCFLDLDSLPFGLRPEEEQRGNGVFFFPNCIFNMNGARYKSRPRSGIISAARGGGGEEGGAGTCP